MSVVHIVLLGKGGVGKTTVATRLAQYYEAHGIPTRNYDTDPVNQSFAGYQALNVTPLTITSKSEEMDFEEIEGLVSEVLESKDEVFIIDNGSTSYLTILKYLRARNAVDILQSLGHEVVFHPIMAGGESFAPSINGLKDLFEQFPTVTKVIWMNEYHGLIEVDGKGFDQSPLYKHFEDQVYALMTLPKYNWSLIGKHLERMAIEKLTFQEAQDLPGSEPFNILVKSSLFNVWREFKAMADEAQLLILPQDHVNSQTEHIQAIEESE